MGTYNNNAPPKKPSGFNPPKLQYGPINKQPTYETTKKPVYNPPKQQYKPAKTTPKAPPKTTKKPVYNPPKKQAYQESSYAPPAPTYKPKPTYKPEKPQYAPPPAPTQAPHIIYAGHPPIHIYQQPQVQSINAAPPTYGAPKQVYSEPKKTIICPASKTSNL